MNGMSERSGLYKLAIVCLVVGLPCTVFGFGYPAWASYDLTATDSTLITGLWQACSRTLDKCSAYGIGDQDAWFEATRGILSVAIILYVVTLIAAAKQVINPDLKREGNALMVLSFITGLIAMTGVIVYGASVHLGLFGSFSVSYWVSLLGAGLSIGAGCFLSANRRSHRGTVIRPYPAVRQVRPRPQHHQMQHVQPVQHQHQHQVSMIGGPMMPGYPPREGTQPPGYAAVHGLSPGYPARDVNNQGYPGPPPAYTALPGQANDDVGAWPAGNRNVPPPPAVYHEQNNNQ